MISALVVIVFTLGMKTQAAAADIGFGARQSMSPADVLEQARGGPIPDSPSAKVVGAAREPFAKEIQCIKAIRRHHAGSDAGRHVIERINDEGLLMFRGENLNEDKYYVLSASGLALIDLGRNNDVGVGVLRRGYGKTYRVCHSPCGIRGSHMHTEIVRTLDEPYIYRDYRFGNEKRARGLRGLFNSDARPSLKLLAYRRPDTGGYTVTMVENANAEPPVFSGSIDTGHIQLHQFNEFAVSGRTWSILRQEVAAYAKEHRVTVELLPAGELARLEPFIDTNFKQLLGLLASDEQRSYASKRQQAVSIAELRESPYAAVYNDCGNVPRLAGAIEDMKKEIARRTY